ncbi:MAG: hypothetical protein HOP14_14270 [Acidobacteria bacterium]|nr:hypothetical protein [Acidobacteriota bacterium]
MSARQPVTLSCLVALLLAATAGTAAAQADIVGYWGQPGQGVSFAQRGRNNTNYNEDAHERQEGPLLVDYLGVPLNEEGRSRALTYDSALLGVPEHVCMRHPSTYSFWGPAQLRIAAELDANLDVVHYTVGGTFRRADRTIWMDGRPHPSAYAPHTWAGFTTGRWEGGTLITTTTHIKWGWIRRNGVPSSDQATVTTYYTRNGDILTITWIVYDPLYLTEPYIKSADFIANPGGVNVAAFDVEPADQGNNFFALCFPREEIATQERHVVPHYLPGENPFVGEHAGALGVPAEATLGGAETMYPEYKDRLTR